VGKEFAGRVQAACKEHRFEWVETMQEVALVQFRAALL
jgi:hypothetical protein